MIMKLKINKWIKGGLTLGENVSIESGCSIDPSFPWLITIGNNVTIAPNVCILAHDASMKYSNGKTKLGAINIGNNVFIGTKSVILPGVTIGDNVIIGAASVVTRSIPNNSVVCGTPAIIISTFEQFRDKNRALIYDNMNYKRTDVLNDENDIRDKMKEKMKEGKFCYIDYK